MTNTLEARIRKMLSEASENDYMVWGFIINEDGEFEAFANQDWSKDQICAATVEAIQNISPDFVKEA